MVRAPCCEKMGLKKGPWTPEEDEILVSYIKRYGHSNWRALPKQAGLLRCGKSCRLRWINYLRPDIKRGNFSSEEEKTIIQLHQVIGNRWSVIAARLPGRTDNEIKNYWHTHLKKRFLQENLAASTDNGQSCTRTTKGVTLMNRAIRSQPVPVNFTANFGRPSSCHAPSFLHHEQEYPCQEVLNSVAKMEAISGFNNTGDDMKFWYNLLVKAGSSSSSEIFENVVRNGQQENPNPH